MCVCVYCIHIYIYIIYIFIHTYIHIYIYNIPGWQQQLKYWSFGAKQLWRLSLAEVHIFLPGGNLNGCTPEMACETVKARNANVLLQQNHRRFSPLFSGSSIAFPVAVVWVVFDSTHAAGRPKQIGVSAATTHRFDDTLSRWNHNKICSFIASLPRESTFDS